MSETNLKRWTRSLGVAAFLAGTSVALSASATVSIPASMVMKVYRFGLSTSPTCENMTIYPVDAPAFVDLTNGPTLGSAAVPFGTYHCVALEIDQALTVAARYEQAPCTTTPETFQYCSVLDLIKNAPVTQPTGPTEPRPGPTVGDGGRIEGPPPDAGGRPPSTNEPSGPRDAGVVAPPPGAFEGVQPLGGNASQIFKTCQTPSDRFVIYLTTQIPQGSRTTPFLPPSSASDRTHGQALGAPLVVGARTTATFLVAMNVVEATSRGAVACHAEEPTFSFQTESGAP